MRISTSNFYDSSTLQLNNLQSSITDLSSQISTGKKGITPQDDPAAAVKILSLNQISATNDQYTKNRSSLTNTLGVASTSMSAMVNTLVSINEQVISASNGTSSAADQITIAQSLQSQLDELVSLSNSNDGAGHYLFSGFNVATAATSTSAVPGSVTLGSGAVLNYTQYGYQGSLDVNSNPTSAQIQVDTKRSLGLGVTAAGLLGTNDVSGATNFLNKLSKAIAVLNSPTHSSVDAQTALNDLGSSYQSTLNNVLQAQSSVGITQNQLTTLDSLNLTKSTDNAKILSSIQDTDYNKALSELSQQQLELTAAQKSFQQISSLSLFNYIN
jgi:flagellar hook-associated protein 3 FlgL